MLGVVEEMQAESICLVANFPRQSKAHSITTTISGISTLHREIGVGLRARSRALQLEVDTE